jgi:hypothetical protein
MLGLAFQDDAADFEAALAEFISDLDGLVGASSGQRDQEKADAGVKRHDPKRTHLAVKRHEPVQPRRHIAEARRTGARLRTRLERPMRSAGDKRPQHDRRHEGPRKRSRERGKDAGTARESGRAEAAAEINSLRLYLANLGQSAGFEITDDGGN